MLEEFLMTQEAFIIKIVLSSSAGNVSKAARALGINHSTLFEKCRRHDIIPDSFRHEEIPKRKPAKKFIYKQQTWLDHKLMLTLNALEDAKWNRAEAARILGISYRTLFKLIAVLRRKGVEIKRSPHGSQAL